MWAILVKFFKTIPETWMDRHPTETWFILAILLLIDFSLICLCIDNYQQRQAYLERKRLKENDALVVNNKKASKGYYSGGSILRRRKPHVIKGDWEKHNMWWQPEVEKKLVNGEIVYVEKPLPKHLKKLAELHKKYAERQRNTPDEAAAASY